MAKAIANRNPIPSQQILLQLLEYAPQTGKLFWKERPASMFATKRAATIWNKRYAKAEAFTCYDAYGYLQGNIFNRRCKAHRVICTMVHGDVASDVDHINGIRDDNRLENLRLVNRAKNLRNIAIRSNNTSGVMGVDRTAKGMWRARVANLSGKPIHVGLFATFEEAVAARKAAETQHGYHANHGRKG